MHRRLISLIGLLMLGGVAQAAEITLLPLGNRAPGVYAFGPVTIPDTATLGILVMDRTNIFAKPLFRADIVGELWTPTERVGGCFGGALGGRRTFRGTPTTPRVICSITFPDLSDLTVQGTMTVSGDSGNVELILEHD